MATHSSILAWKIPQTKEPGGYRPRGHRELDLTERLSLTHSRGCLGSMVPTALLSVPCSWQKPEATLLPWTTSWALAWASPHGPWAWHT